VSELELRASDADREQALALLTEHCAAGRLTLDELADRIDVVHAARTQAELAEVLRDLPAPRPAPRRRPARFSAAVFSHVVRRGRLRLGGWTWAGSLFGDLDLDLRQAQLDGPRTTVVATANFGNVDVYVPEGVDADIAGLSIFGHSRSWGRDSAHAGAPIVRIRVLGLFATFDLWRVPRGTPEDLSVAIKHVRAGQKELTP
jgi:uncharacterized protein DUF1707/cell wall-active antibiotic response 4TMS protein YvqF